MIARRGLLMVVALAGVASADAVPMTATERRLWGQLHRSVWASEIGESDVDAIIDGLRETHRTIVVMAITNAVAHGRKELVARLRDVAIGRKDYCAGVAVVAATSLETPDDDAGATFRKAACAERTSDAKRAALTAVAVRLQVRELRLGRRKTTNTEGLKLTDYERLLLEYAKMGADEAIDALIARMEGLDVIREPWSSVLASYGDLGCQAAINRLVSDRRASVYGTIALLTTLTEAAASVSPTMRADVAVVARRYAEDKEPRIKTAAEATVRALTEVEEVEKEERKVK